MTGSLESKKTGMKKNITGFTLIELMIVVIVIGVLAAIALPTYGDYVKRGRIAEGLVPLADMEARLEQFFQDNRTYVGACTANTVAPAPGTTEFFRYKCDADGLATDKYTVKAEGLGAMLGFVYVLSLSNGKVNRSTEAAPEGWAGDTIPKDCWIRGRGGLC